MGTCTYGCLMNVINIGNSIIGVSILAMPYCFRKCGILLSVVLILLSGLLTRLACHLLLKSAIMARRRNFEYLAFHIFGSSGKLAVEISIVGFLIGVCIAFFVVIGDLGPPLVTEFLEIQNSSNLRTNVLVLVGLCVALPLGMLRKIDSLTSLSALSIAFYGFLVLKIFFEAIPILFENEWWYEVNWWQSDGILPCLPIFSMALSCQTQLFEFFDTLNDPSLKRMQSVVSGAVHLCSAVYILVGTFGYIAFHNKVITGNALTLFTPSMTTECIKLGFIITVAVSFPLCLFPCRSSLHSLLFKQAFGHHDIAVNVIPDHRFRILTVSLVIVTIGIAIMLPNIEFVLGIIGSTIGTLICLIFPAMMFIHDTSKNTSEKRLAQVLLCIGMFILIACTYTTLRENNEHPAPVSIDKVETKVTHKLIADKLAVMSSVMPIATQLPEKKKENVIHSVEPEVKAVESFTKAFEVSDDQKRLEPPVPQEPDVEHAADLDPQALQKEDKELQKDEKKVLSNLESENKNKEDLDKQQQLLLKLEEQHKEQKLILEQQKQVLQELKLHKEEHEEQKKVDILEKGTNLKDIPEKLPKNVRKIQIPEGVIESSSEKIKESQLPVADKVKDIPKDQQSFNRERVVKSNSSNLLNEKMNEVPVDKFPETDNKKIPLVSQKFEEKISEARAIERFVIRNSSENVIDDTKLIPKNEYKIDSVMGNTSAEAGGFKVQTKQNQRDGDKSSEKKKVQSNGAKMAKREILQNNDRR